MSITHSTRVASRIATVAVGITIAGLTVGAAPALAPPQSSFPAAGAAPFPGGGFGGPPGPPTAQAGAEECMKGFMPLREEAVERRA